MHGYYAAALGLALQGYLCTHVTTIAPRASMHERKILSTALTLGGVPTSHLQRWLVPTRLLKPVNLPTDKKGNCNNAFQASTQHPEASVTIVPPPCTLAAHWRPLRTPAAASYSLFTTGALLHRPRPRLPPPTARPAAAGLRRGLSRRRQRATCRCQTANAAQPHRLAAPTAALSPNDEYSRNDTYQR